MRKSSTIGLLLLLCLVASSLLLKAQYIPVPSTLNTPYGKVNTTTYHYMPMHHYGNQGAVWNSKHLYTVVKRNGDTLTVKGRIKTNEYRHKFTYKQQGKKQFLNPRETKSITRISSMGDKLVGIPADTCWLFIMKTGAINLYSAYDQPNSSYITAIQKGTDGRVVSLNKRNLLKMVGEEPKLIALIEKGNLLKAIEEYNKLNIVE